MKPVIEQLSTFPRLIGGTVTSIVGAVAGNSQPLLESQHSFQTVVWTASIFAAIMTGALAATRIVIEIQKARREKLL